jgi:hypothetical protein
MFRSFWVCLAPRLQVTVNERLYPGRQLPSICGYAMERDNIAVTRWGSGINRLAVGGKGIDQHQASSIPVSATV